MNENRYLPVFNGNVAITGNVQWVEPVLHFVHILFTQSKV